MQEQQQELYVEAFGREQLVVIDGLADKPIVLDQRDLYELVRQLLRAQLQLRRRSGTKR